jgi:glycosyltransferase involved in cell wall biosynthesis
MNIAFDAKRAFHNTRGLGNYSRDTLRLLSSNFPENTLFLFNPSSKRELVFPLSKNMIEVFPTSYAGNLFSSFWRSYGMCSQIKSIKPDIYHGLSQELPIGIKKTRVKTVVTMHDAIFMRYPELYPTSYRSIFIHKNKYACRVADHIIAISEQTKRDIVNYFNADEDKISVVYQGCNNIFRQPVSIEKRKSVQDKYQLPQQFLLTVGSIEKRKNTILIIEAIHRFRLSIPLLIIGKQTPYINDLQKLIHQYGMEQQVKFIQHAETVDLPAIYALSKIFIYPSIFEGFGLPILEALCSGAPVVSSKGSCFEETGGPGSKYIDPNNADELGEVLSNLLSDNVSLERMSKEGLLFASKFEEKQIAQELMKVYKSL